MCIHVIYHITLGHDSHEKRVIILRVSIPVEIANLLYASDKKPVVLLAATIFQI